MKILQILFAALFCAFILGACGTVATTGSAAESRLVNSMWTLNATQSGMSIEGDMPNLSFDLDENLASGMGGCNRYSGSIIRGADGSIRFGDIMATKMACPNLALENRFFEMLRETNRYEIVGNSLILYKNNLKLLQFDGR